MKTCGLGGKADNPILQAADMLAYSEWKYLTQSGGEIFDALHINNRPYRMHLFDIGEMIEPIKAGVGLFEAARKEYGRRKHRH